MRERHLNWYQVLGVRPDAGAEELRAAHRAAVRELHPDVRSPEVPAEDADAALRLLNDAWAVLGDPVRRAAYDAGLEESAFAADEEPWLRHAPTRFPWWILVLAVLLVIFVFTAYAAPGPAPLPTSPK